MIKMVGCLDPQENIVHDITVDDINQLLNYAEQDELWAAAVKTEVTNRDEAIKNGTYAKKTDWLTEEFQIMQTSGTVIQMPFGLRIITLIIGGGGTIFGSLKFYCENVNFTKIIITG